MKLGCSISSYKFPPTFQKHYDVNMYIMLCCWQLRLALIWICMRQMICSSVLLFCLFCFVFGAKGDNIVAGRGFSRPTQDQSPWFVGCSWWVHLQTFMWCSTMSAKKEVTGAMPSIMQSSVNERLVVDVTVRELWGVEIWQNKSQHEVKDARTQAQSHT